MKHVIGQWVMIGKYVLTLEDSRDTVYRVPLSPSIQRLPHYAGTIKIVFWTIMALGLAIAISQLQ